MTRYHRLLTLGIALALATLTADTTQAQTQRAFDWQRSSSLFAVGGVSKGASETGVTIGGAIAWEVTNRFIIEGSGSWLDRGPGTDGFAAQLGATISLLPAGAARVIPHVGGGFGFYRASFDLPPGVPAYYGRRLGATTHGPVFQTRSFTDPAFTVAGGLTIAVTEHVLVRPEMSVLVAMADGESHRIGVLRVNVGYRFRALPIQR